MTKLLTLNFDNLFPPQTCSRMMMATTFSRPNDPGSHAQSMLRKSHSQVFLVLESKGLYYKTI